MSTFFQSAKRATRGIPRKTLHVLLEDLDKAKLVKLTKRWKASAAEVIRRLIREAKP